MFNKENSVLLYKDVEISLGDVTDLDLVYPSLVESFPPCERKSYEYIKDLMIEIDYKLVIAKHKIDKQLIGFAFLFIEESEKMLWLDFIAIEEKFQSLGYGSILFKGIIELLGSDKKGMFLEIEKPDDINLNRSKRVVFYNRLGCITLDCLYYLPTPIIESPLEMLLLYKPISKDKIIPSDVVKKVIIAEHKNVHKDITLGDEILSLFIDGVGDIEVGKH